MCIYIDELSAEEIAHKAMTIAADTCVYTNHNFTVETLTNPDHLLETAGEEAAASGTAVDNNNSI